MTPTQSELRQLRLAFENELFSSVLPFWETHSPDRQNGGYFNHLARDGAVFDPTKNVWLQARQVWQFSKFYTSVAARPAWLEMAELGLNFLRRHALTPDGRVYFSLSATGQPIYQQRKIFSECFYAMALAEYARAAGVDSLAHEARQMFDRIWAMVQEPALAGRPILDGAPPLQTLAVPMIILNLVDEIAGADYKMYRAPVAWSIARVREHFVDGQLYENVAPGGGLRLDLAAGRLQNPGHAIEAGWFLMHWALRLEDAGLRRLAAAIIRSTFAGGWDKMYGGLFSFVDVTGRSPLPLEWDMKMWWPHNEALYAFLLLYRLDGDPEDWCRFQQVRDYAFNHFSDPLYGEWFGYLNRRGEPTHTDKGGPYKGCFHVPRSLWLCTRLLAELEAND